MTMTVDTTTNAINTAVAPPPAAPTQPAAAALVQAGQQGPYSAARADFELAQRRAKVLSQSTLVPEAYRGMDGLANCMIALNLADRIGADPFAVIQNLDIIHGRPGLRATFLIATVNAATNQNADGSITRRFTPLRYRFEGKAGSDEWGCRAVATDRESGEELVGSLITIGMAKAEGWATKNGSKWRTMPEQMLMYRAASFWTRVYSPELSLGIQTSEEVADITEARWVTEPAGKAARTKELEQALLASPRPPAPPPSTPDAVVEPVTTVAAAEPEKVEESKPSKKAPKVRAEGSLPTGDLLPVVAKPNDGIERDPLTGEIVPPMREPGDDSEELP